MSKPWGRYEIGYINHPKFRALNQNAICLWWECKNYCDEFHTDGLVPCSVVRGFRFHGAKAVDLLTRSCGMKPNHQSYAPLWERIDIGGVCYYRMHDYLDHNDCRDKVMDRIAKAEERREEDRKRKAAARDAKRVHADKCADIPADNDADTVRTVHGIRGKSASNTETETPTPTESTVSGDLKSLSHVP